MSSCIGVDSQKQIKLAICNFDDAIEISRFECAVEYKLILVMKGGVHPFEGAVKYGRFIIMIIL
jgi:hypothetical protein